MEYKRDANGNIRDFTKAEIEQFHVEREARREAVLQAEFASPTPTAMYVMGMCSDAQELISRGMTEEANDVLNDIKVIIDERMSKKDEHGRQI